MRSVLFVIPPPPNQQKWAVYLTHVDPKLTEGVLRLAENVWLVDFGIKPDFLARLIHVAAQFELPYMMLPFDGELQWLPDGTDPKTMEDRSGG